MKKILGFILKLLISAGLLYIFLSRVDTGTVIITLKKTSIRLFALAFFIYICTVFIAAKRWSLFLPQGLKYFQMVSLCFVGSFFNTFLPGIVGGDAVKAYYLYKHTGKGTGSVSIASVFMDRYMGMIALACIALIALIIGHAYLKGTDIMWFISAFLIGLLFTSLILWKVNWGRIKFLSDVYTPLMEYKAKKGIISKGLLLGFIVQCANIIGVYILSHSIGLNVPIVYFFVFIPIIGVASSIPVSVAGLGIREAAFVILFSKAGLPSAEAVSLSLLVFTLMCMVNALGGIEYLRIGKPAKR